MAREIEKLSALKVSKIKKTGYFSDGAGLYLQVSAAGTKSWILRYTLAGKAREMGLGALHTISLADARIEAAERRKAILAGRDPIDERNALKAALRAQDTKLRTFRECALAYIKTHRSGWKNAKHASQWENTFRDYAFPKFGHISVAAVDTGLVLQAIEPIWSEKPETASRVRGRIESVLNWATARGYRHGENPARLRGHIDKLLPKISKVKRVKHHAALPFAETGAFMKSLRTQEGIAPRALEFAILTAARTNEVLMATWREFDLKTGVWTIPAERMKAGKEHRVPLSARALAIVEEMKKNKLNDFVFPGLKEDKPLSTMALLMTLRRMEREDLTVHGFRSTFRDWASETTSYARDAVEMALAHTIGDKVEAAYRRGDLFEKRSKLMADWATYCNAPKVSGKVVQLRKRVS